MTPAISSFIFYAAYAAAISLKFSVKSSGEETQEDEAGTTYQLIKINYYKLTEQDVLLILIM